MTANLLEILPRIWCRRWSNGTRKIYVKVVVILFISTKEIIRIYLCSILKSIGLYYQLLIGSFYKHAFNSRPAYEIGIQTSLRRPEFCKFSVPISYPDGKLGELSESPA